MGEPIDRTARPSPRVGRSAVVRVLGNAGLLAFASLLVISLSSGRLSAALLWAGALLVFFAAAFDRRVQGAPASWWAGRADALRWCGLALSAAGAALLLT